MTTQLGAESCGDEPQVVTPGRGADLGALQGPFRGFAHLTPGPNPKRKRNSVVNIFIFSLCSRPGTSAAGCPLLRAQPLKKGRHWRARPKTFSWVLGARALSSSVSLTPLFLGFMVTFSQEGFADNLSQSSFSRGWGRQQKQAEKIGTRVRRPRRKSH